MAILYIWKTNLLRLRVGHSSLLLDNSYISFWPANKQRINFRAFWGQVGEWGKSYNDDCAWQGSEATVKFALDNLDEEEVKKLWEKYRNTRYSLFGTNCCTITINLIFAGMHKADTLSNFLKLTPDDVLRIAINYRSGLSS
jgi:hypothetical protein